MSLINFSNTGRTGNQMFAVAFCAILANELNCQLIHHPGGEIPHDWFPNIKTFGKEPSRVSFVWPDIEINDTVRDIASAVLCCRGRRVSVRGFFEMADFYIPHRDMLLNLFAQDLADVESLPVIFQVRGGDFVSDGQHKDVPLAFYTKAWEELGRPESVRVVTDDPAYAISLFKDVGFKIEGEPIVNPPDGFKAMRRAKNLVISRSTFAWWAAFLSDANVLQASATSDYSRPTRNLTNPNWKQIPC